MKQGLTDQSKKFKFFLKCHKKSLDNFEAERKFSADRVDSFQLIFMLA